MKLIDCNKRFIVITRDRDNKTITIINKNRQVKEDGP